MSLGFLSTKTCRPGTELAGWAYWTRTGESVRELFDWNSVTTSRAVGAGRRRRPFAFQLRHTDLQLGSLPFVTPGVGARCGLQGAARQPVQSLGALSMIDALPPILPCWSLASRCSGCGRRQS
jgi:hypothetical protein